MLSRTLWCRLLSMVALGLATAGFAQQKPSLGSVLDARNRVKHYTETAISPDGKHVAWVESVMTDGVSGNCDAIYVQGLGESGPAQRITAANKACDEEGIAWSPDSHQLAFLSDAPDGEQLQVFVASLAGGDPRQLTHVKGFLQDLKWSFDGKTIAVLFTENAPRSAGPLEPMTPDAGVVEEHFYEARLATIDTASGSLSQVSPADMYVYEYDWSPDSRQFVASAAHGSGDNNYWLAQLYVLGSTGGEMRSILKPTLQIAVPRWSPDGKWIAYIHGLMSDQGSTGGDIFLISPAGGEPAGGQPKNITPNFNGSPSWLQWAPGSDKDKAQRLVFSGNVDGMSGIAEITLPDGKIHTLLTEAAFIDGQGWGPSFSMARNGEFAVVRSSTLHPQEVWVKAGPRDSWRQFTHGNDAIHPLWGQTQSLHWTSDNFHVQGWLMLPYNYDPAKRYPLVVVVHGGPSGACAAAWPKYFEAPLSSQGYFTLCPNPRGSYGQGETFAAANVKDFGYGDFRDIMRGVDQALKEYPLDPDRVGIMGWSYGGYMTMWAVTQTNRFRAAVSGAGLANFQSYYGQNDIDQWMIPFFGASVYDDPKVYERSSPITFIKKVKTPTLLLVGERDGEVPAPQSYEFWHALKTLGVKTQLVVYPGEGHMFHKAENMLDVLRRSTQWFDENMPAKP